LIESWYADGQVEFVGQFAAQLPARVIGDLLGLPRADIPSFTKLVYLVTRFISASILPDEIPESEAACQQLRDYVEKTLEDRRRAPRDDFLSDFLGKADAAGELSPLEIIFQIVQLIVGGTDTTRVAIVVQLALLLQHREQWDAVCRDPSLIPGAVAEAMRFNSPARSTDFSHPEIFSAVSSPMLRTRESSCLEAERILGASPKCSSSERARTGPTPSIMFNAMNASRESMRL